MTPQVRRALFGPVLVTGALAALSALVAATAVLATGVVSATPVVREGWLLAWLLLGLTAGYALSGSA